MSEVKHTAHSLMEEAEQIDVDALMAEYDRESNTRHYTGVPRKIVRCILVVFSLYIFYMNLFSVWPEQIRRTSFVGFIIFMAFALYPAKKKSAKRENYVPWYDIVLGIVGAACFAYFIINFETLSARATRITQLDVIVGVVGLLITAEVSPRVRSFLAF